MARYRKPVPSRFWQQLFREFFSRKFPQVQDMSAGQFVSFAKKCGIRTSTEDLAHFEKKGMLSPLYRTTYDYDKDDTFTYFYLPGTREFKELQQKKEERDSKRLFFISDHYHPYQLFLLNALVSRLPRFGVRYWSQSEERLRSRVISIRNNILHGVEDEARSWQTTRFTTLLRLLLELEQRYRPEVVGTFSAISLSRPGKPRHPPTLDEWYKWSARFDAKKLASKFSVTLRDLEGWHRVFAIAANNHDPLKKWYYLVRHVPFKKREELEGKALLAQQYYVAGEMIRLFAKDAFQADLPRENVWQHEQEWDEYEKKLYGKRLTFHNPKTLEYILNEYRINPQSRLLVFVEGHSEKLGIEMLAEATGIDLQEESIEIVNLSGERNFDVNKLEHYLRDLQKRHVRYLFVLDPHDRAVNGIEKLIKKSAVGAKSTGLLTKEQCIIWNKDFERDNFTPAQIVRSVNKLIGGDARRRLTIRDLEKPEYVNREQSLEHLVRQTISSKTISKAKLSHRLFKDHVIGKRGIRPSHHSPFVEFFFRMIKEARSNFRPTVAESAR